MSDNNQSKHVATDAIRSGYERGHENEHSESIFTTSSFVFRHCAEGEARMAKGQEGNVYSRYTNPTVRSFEKRLAAMEKAQQAVATASGMAAITSTIMATLKQGDHILCSRDVFGSTVVLLENFFIKMGIDVSYVDLVNIDQWRLSIQSNTRMLFLESPSNPLNRVADIKALAQLAHQNEALLVVDNCFCTPVLQQPLTLGADIVIHSATKYIDGQGRMLGGAVCGSEELMQSVLAFVRAAGPCMSSFNAWVFLKGLETLPLRMRAHSDNAMQVALWLKQQPLVEQVFYAGLPEHPSHQLACEQQKGFGGVLAFTVKSLGQSISDKEAAWHLIDSMKMLSITPNLGDAKTTIIHPASTTHGRIGDEARRLSGITDNLIRISVGLEFVEDIIADLQQGLSLLELQLNND